MNREVLTRPMPESNSILVITGPPCRCDADPPVQHGLVRGIAIITIIFNYFIFYY
jgi:hypothetical protein